MIFILIYAKDDFKIMKEQMPLVSILIPTYNRPDYFKIAFESALNQTYSNIEVIVCDNSTNEKTNETINRTQYCGFSEWLA